MKDRNLQSRITGAILGLACGDALGAPAEFRDKAYVTKKWGILKEMVGGGMWEPGEWTDDTGMMLCLAGGILANPEDPIEESGKRFLAWRETAKDVGSTISAALSGYRGDWSAAARNTPQAKQGHAAGNGSLMRTLPVALAYGPDTASMVRAAARASAMTHWDGEAETCCILYCLWINQILEGQSLRDAWHQALKQGREIAKEAAETPETPGGRGTLESGFWQRMEAVESLRYDELQPSGYAGYVVECLEAAAWCCLNSSSLEEAIVQVVNLGGESDTMGAVAGGAAGAYWGAESIPGRWLDKLRQRAELEETARRLGALRRHNQVYSKGRLPPFNASWVTDRIMAGRNPLTCRDVELLAAWGITHVLDLRQQSEWKSREQGRTVFGAEAVQEIERRGLKRLNVEVADTGAPTSHALDRAYEFLQEAMKDGDAVVYVHCRAGLERTGAILAGYYARSHGVSYEEALSKLRQGRPDLRPMCHQEQTVREWLTTRAASENSG